jgi:hypothetical protein
MLDKHILEESLVSMVLLKDDNKFGSNKLKYISSDIEVNVFGLEDSGNNQQPNGYREVVFHKTIYDENEEKVNIPIKLLNKSKKIELIYNYDDIHLYVFNKNIFNLLEDDKVKNLTMIKNDLIPFLIKYKDSKRLNSHFHLLDGETGNNNYNHKEDPAKLKKINIKGYLVDNNQKNYA